MSDKKFCDTCGCETFLNPLHEQEMEDRVVKVEIPDPKDATKTVTHSTTVKAPKMTTIKRQNLQTGKIEDVPAPCVKYLQRRSILVRVQVGLVEYVQRDFCDECYKKHQKRVMELWDYLEKIEPK